MTDYLLGTKLSVILVFIIGSMVFAFMSHSFHGYDPFCRDNVKNFVRKYFPIDMEGRKFFFLSILLIYISPSLYLLAYCQYIKSSGLVILQYRELIGTISS